MLVVRLAAERQNLIEIFLPKFCARSIESGARVSFTVRRFATLP
jgi:hypothetical protein